MSVALIALVVICTLSAGFACFVFSTSGQFTPNPWPRFVAGFAGILVVSFVGALVSVWIAAPHEVEHYILRLH